MISRDHWQPSNERQWVPQHQVQPAAVWEGARVRIQNVRNFDYVTERDFVARYYNRELDLAELQTVDFLVVPFRGAPALAHTMVSFGLSDGSHLVVSVEVRLEEGETYNPLLGALKRPPRAEGV